MATDPTSLGMDKLIISLKNKLGRQRKVADDTEEQIKALETLAKSASDQLEIDTSPQKRK